MTTSVYLDGVNGYMGVNPSKTEDSKEPGAQRGLSTGYANQDSFILVTKITVEKVSAGMLKQFLERKIIIAFQDSQLT